MPDLAIDEIRAKLRAIWTQPLALDPARISARVTRTIAAQLAQLAQSLESSGHPSESLAAFLMRYIFTMYAEDIGLLAKEFLNKRIAERHGRGFSKEENL